MFEVDSPVADRPLHQFVLDDVDVVLGKPLNVLVVGGQFVVVVARKQSDRDGFAGGAKLLEQFRIRFDENVELLGAVDGGELPESERITVDDQFCVLVGRFQPFEKSEQFVQKLYVFELFVSADVEVTDHVVGRIARLVSHRLRGSSICYRRPRLRSECSIDHWSFGRITVAASQPFWPE